MTLPQLRPLLSLDDGTLEPAHEGVVGLLAQISDHEEVRDWLVTAHGGLPGDAAWSLPDAARALDKLQDIASSSPWGLSIWREERLRSFGKVPGIGAEIARRLEQDLHPAEQQLLLDLALVIDVPEPLFPAARILQDDHRDERVREAAAALVAALGTVEHLAPLAYWVEAMQEDPGKAVLSPLKVAFYKKGLWSFEKAAEHAIAGSTLHNDWLQSCLEADLNLGRARWLIRQPLLPHADRPRPSLVTRALEKIQEQKIPEEVDIELLVPLFHNYNDFMEGERVRKFLESSPAARRKLFLEGIARGRQGERQWSWRYFLLNGEDAEWLLAQFRTREDRPAWLLGALHFVAYSQGVPPALRRRIRQTLRGTDAQTLRALDEERKSWAADNQQRWQKWRGQEKRAKAPIYQLELLVLEALDSDELELRHKMLQLSWYCFEPPSQRPSNLSGRWEDLPADLRSEVLAVCREALAQCPPTPIPATSSYSQRTSLEAACFDRLAKEDAGFVLMPELIQKWLPALLRTWVTESGFEPTLRRCFEVDRNLAEGLFCQEIRRSALTEKGTYILHYLTPDLWSVRFSGLLEAVVADSEVAPETRIYLLGRIARIFPERARPIALTWAEGPDASLRDAGIDLLLMVAPEEGWRYLKALIEHEEPRDVLRRMRSLLPHHYGPSAVFNSWPAARLAELAELLLSNIPSDPVWEEGQVRFFGEEAELRSVQDHIPQLLYRRDGEGDHETLEALAARHRRIREWLDDVRVQEGAESVIAGLGRSTRPPGEGRRVPPADLLKLLQSAEHRLLGSTDDLQDVVLEELRRIAKEAGQHLSMLYYPKPAKDQERRHLHEDALQAYIACRLTDRLPRILEARGLKIEPSVDRETLASQDTRNDIKIQAPSIDGTRLTVIIEIKWSDHRDVSTSLVDQLGEGYLLQNNLTHGIYLVGWSCRTVPWKSALSPAPEPRSSREAWQKALADQAALFCQAHPRLRIIPLVLDLAWEPEPG